MNISKKLGLLAIPLVAGLGAVGAMSITSAHAAPQPVDAAQHSTVPEKVVKDATEVKGAPETSSESESPETNKVDSPDGPSVEQTGQNESTN